MTKRYFWLKLKDDFFNQKEIKMLRRVSGGDTFTIIYLKLLLVSLKNDGKIYYDGIANNMAEEVALDIDEEIENVQITLNYMQQKGLLVFNSDEEIELSDIHQMIGSETAAASRMRKHRALKNEQERNGVTKELRDGYTEIEIEIEKEIDIETEIEAAVVVNQYYEKNGFGSITEKTKRDFEDWIKDFVKIGATVDNAKSIVLHALDISIDNNVRKYNYAKSILTNWESKRYITVEQIEAEERKRKKNGNHLSSKRDGDYDDLF